MSKLLLLIPSLLACCAVSAQHNIDGAYERVSLTNTRNGESPEAANRQGLLILAFGHYSMMTMNPDRKAAAKGEAIDDWPSAEQIAYYRQWLDINAHSGRYEIDGDTLVWHRNISEDPNEVDTVSRLGFEQKDDLLVLFFTLPNGDRYDWVWRRIR